MITTRRILPVALGPAARGRAAVGGLLLAILAAAPVRAAPPPPRGHKE